MKRHFFTLLLLLPVSLMGSQPQQTRQLVQRNQDSSFSCCCFGDMCWPIKNVCGIFSSCVRGLTCCIIAENADHLKDASVDLTCPHCLNCLCSCFSDE